MSIYGVERKYRFGDFRFEVAYDSGNEASLEQRDIYRSEQPPSDPRWVRSFYFEDVSEHHIRAFCKRFAEDETYRRNCLEQKTDWAIRDRLFRRNIASEHWQESPVVKPLGGVPAAYDFFKEHWKAIVSLEEYQRIQHIDSAFEPSRYEIDPEIREAVECFNQIPGVKTKFSCQGVTKTIIYENLNILVDSPHARLAYISFETLPSLVESMLQTYSSSIAQYKPLWKMLESTGDNLQFRQIVLNLASSLGHPV
jgi:hypothetical protein